MKYELAKQLSEAGWQPKSGWQKAYNSSQLVGIDVLEELIEACKSHIISLEHMDGKWKVFSHESQLLFKTPFSDTPTEAVANLWLALNKK